METEGQMPVPTSMPGFAWRVSASILLGCGWLAFLIIWLFFYAANWDVYQNLAILLVSIVIVIGVLAAMWASFGMRMAERVEGGAPWRHEMRHWRRRGIVPAILWLGWLVFLVIWLFFYAGNYNGYQNLAILIVSLIIVGGVSSVVRRTTWR